MKRLKLFEQFDDPFGEETLKSYEKTFSSWFKDEYSNDSTRDFVFTTLTRINCSYAELTSLKGIEKLINLKKLFCYNNRLSDIDEIKSLFKLEELWCYNNSFSEEYKDWLRNYCKEKNIGLVV
jgi:hypothetical protein